MNELLAGAKVYQTLRAVGLNSQACIRILSSIKAEDFDKQVSGKVITKRAPTTQSKNYVTYDVKDQAVICALDNGRKYAASKFDVKYNTLANWLASYRKTGKLPSELKKLSRSQAKNTMICR